MVCEMESYKALRRLNFVETRSETSTLTFRSQQQKDSIERARNC